MKTIPLNWGFLMPVNKVDRLQSVPIVQSSGHTMRKIETQMIEAINNRKDWKSANTEVYVNDNNCANVYLHGNLIAWVNKDNDLTVFDGGWQTVTTKSRLNALCNEFCLRGECIFQKDFVWYVRKLVGAINGQNVYQTEDFFSGYVFA